VTLKSVVQQPRLAVTTGFVAVAFFVASFAVPGASLTDAKPSNKTMLLLAFLLLWMGTACFLWFLAALRAYLSRYEERLSATAFVAGLVAMGVVLVTTIAPASFAAVSSPAGPTAAMRAWFSVGKLALVLTGAPSAVLIGAASIVILRRAALPRWTAWLGFLAIAVNVIGLAAIFETHGPLAPSGPLGVAGAGLIMCWILAIAGTMRGRLPVSICSHTHCACTAATSGVGCRYDQNRTDPGCSRRRAP
jgi:hypothetical protein